MYTKIFFEIFTLENNYRNMKELDKKENNLQIQIQIKIQIKNPTLLNSAPQSHKKLIKFVFYFIF